MIFVLILASLSFAEQSQSYAFSAGQTLYVELEQGGNLTIIGESRNDLSLEHHGAEDVVMDVNQTKDGLSVVATLPRNKRHKLAVTIRLPNQANIDVKTTGGNLQIEQIEGRIEAATMGGNVQLTQLRGELAVKTMGGNIGIDHSQVSGHVKTMGGNISLSNTPGLVDCETMGGNINVDNPNSPIDGRVEPVKVKTYGGNIKVVEAPTGLIGETMGGNINIGSAKFVDVETKGGNIRVDAVDGYATAHTMGGNITIIMVGDPDDGERDVDLDSKGGDINVHLPAGFSGEFDIEIKQTNDRKPCKITSEFALKQSTEGTRHKVIRASGQTVTGRHRVVIRTVNGDVNIVKTQQ
ncbi:MAG: DUF4097 family beta strand repeat protein [Acidobacteria bacterium]|nr:DUF4097 family beta strand repeat protein [Acidobacteriota bacterium]